MVERCATCPRILPGLCFSERHNTPHLCERHAAGDMAYAALLTGEVEPTPAPDLPGLLTMAANLASAAVAVVASGGEQVTEEAYEARMAVCSTCPHLRPEDWRCGGPGGCGCHLRAKARFKALDCPLGFWPVEAQSCDDPKPNTA